MLRVERGGDDVEGNAQLVAKRLEVGGVRFVVDIAHANMQGLDGKVGHMDLGTASQELKKTERVLATRQADEDAVILVDKLVLTQRFVKLFPKMFVERHLLHENQIDGTDDE